MQKHFLSPPPPKPTQQDKKGVLDQRTDINKDLPICLLFIRDDKIVCFVMHRNNVFISSRMV